MTATAGYRAIVKASGTPTVFSNEPMTDSGDGLTFVMDDTTKHVLDPDTAVVVEASEGGPGGWTAAPASAFHVDYLFGRVTFTSDQSGKDVRISGKYVPMRTIGTARGASLQITRSILDATRFNTDGAEQSAYGLLKFSGSLELLEDLRHDHGTGPDPLAFYDALTDGALKVIEYRPAPNARFFRGWAVFESQDVKAAPDDLAQATVSFTGTSRRGAGQTEGAAISRGT